MNPIWRRRLAVFAAAGLLAGCATTPSTSEVKRIHDEEVKQLKTFFVVKNTNDARGVNAIVAEQLNFMGFVVTTGESAAGVQADAVVTYDATWERDAMYLLEIRIEVPRAGEKPRTFSSRSYLGRKKPPEMAHELLQFMLDRAMSPFGK